MTFHRVYQQEPVELAGTGPGSAPAERAPISSSGSS